MLLCRVAQLGSEFIMMSVNRVSEFGKLLSCRSSSMSTSPSGSNFPSAFDDVRELLRNFRVPFAHRKFV